MSIYRNLPVSRKLTGIVLLTCGVAVIVACTIFAVYDTITYRRSMADQLRTVAASTGSNTTAAITFGDSTSAGETLALSSRNAYRRGLYL